MSKPKIEVLFSPGGSCTAAIVRELQVARASIRVQAYSFTSGPIAKALCDAKARGVDVRVLIDNSYASKPKVALLRKATIHVYVDREHSIAHNKVMVIDGKVVITGSFNFTYAAEKENAENLLIIRDNQIASEYEHNWLLHFGHSQK